MIINEQKQLKKKKESKSPNINFTNLPYYLILEITQQFFYFKLPLQLPSPSPSPPENQSITSIFPVTIYTFFGKFKFDKMFKKIFLIFGSISFNHKKILKILPVQKLISLESRIPGMEENANIPNEFLKKCTNMKCLEKVNLCEKAFENLKHLNCKLEKLCFMSEEMSESILKYLNMYKKLRVLGCGYNNKEENILPFKEDLKINSLEKIIARIPTSVSFIYLINLRVIIVISSILLNYQIENIVMKCKSLKEIQFSECNLENLYYKVFEIEGIQRVSILNCEVENDNLKLIKFPLRSNLQYIKLRGLEGIPIQFVEQFKNLKNLKKINFDECHISKEIRKMLDEFKNENVCIGLKISFAIPAILTSPFFLMDDNFSDIINLLNNLGVDEESEEDEGEVNDEG